MDDFTLHEALKLAVKTEQIAEKVYTRFAKKFADNKEVAEVFERLAKDHLEAKKEETFGLRSGEAVDANTVGRFQAGGLGVQFVFNV